jgi:hypothetical protein
MSAVTIASPMPAVSVLVSDEALNRIDKALHTSGVIAVIPDGDEQAFKVADAAYQALQVLSREVESTRETLKAPALAFGRSLDAAARDAVAPIEAEKARLGAVIKGWQVRENAKREEAARVAREAAAAAAKEAQRIADEAAKAKEAARIAALPQEDPEPGVDPEPVPEAPVFTAPVKPAVIIPTVMARPMVTSSVREKRAKVLVIEDASQIPRELSGAVLLVPDESQIKRLLTAGIKVPGCRLDEVVGTAPTVKR